MGEDETHEAEALGFKRLTVADVKVGDEVAYYRTMFGLGMGSLAWSTITEVTRPEPDTYPELVRLAHTGTEDPHEAEESEPIWVRRG